MPPSRANRDKTSYNYRWGQYRRRFLQRHPLCVMCRKAGKAVQATVVDHIIPHKGDYDLFWDPANHQPLCKLHHDAAKAKEESRGYSTEVGLDGWPTDPRHPVNK